jgi:hypothetical protein
VGFVFCLLPSAFCLLPFAFCLLLPFAFRLRLAAAGTCHTIEAMLLRFASLLILVVWIGGLATLGFLAAPAIFAVLEARDPEAGRTLAALTFGAVLSRFNRFSWILGGVLLGVLGLRAALGPRPRRLGIRMWSTGAMLAASLTVGLWIAPRIEAIRASSNGPIANLPAADPTRVEFGRLHSASTVLMVVTLLIGTGLIWMEMKDG